MKTHYDVLSVSPNADPETIKAAYRKRMKVFHPDLHQGGDAAELRSKQIITAYGVLKNTERRARYDQHLRNRRSRLRMFAFTVLVSAGLVSGGTLFLLQFLLKPETNGPVARIATAVVESPAPLQDPAAEPAPPAVALAPAEAVPTLVPATPVVAAYASPAPAVVEPAQAAPLTEPQQPAAARETAWRQIEKTGRAEDIPVFTRDNPGTPEAELAERRLVDLIDTVDDVASLKALAAKAKGAVAERALGRIGKLTPAKEILTAALPEQPAKAPAAQTSPAAAPAAGAQPAEPRQAEAAHDGAPTKLASSDARAIAQHALSLMTTPTSRDATPITPGNANYYVHRAAAWAKMGDLERAMTDYDAAILLDDANIEAFHGRGLVRARRGEVELALADFDRAIRLSFADPKIYLDRGTLWYQRGRYDRAIADFNQAIKLSPGLASAYSYRGTALRRKRDFKSAIADLDQAIRLNPAIVDAYRNRDLARTGKDDPVEASADVAP